MLKPAHKSMVDMHELSPAHHGRPLEWFVYSLFDNESGVSILTYQLLKKLFPDTMMFMDRVLVADEESVWIQEPMMPCPMCGHDARQEDPEANETQDGYLLPVGTQTCTHCMECPERAWLFNIVFFDAPHHLVTHETQRICETKIKTCSPSPKVMLS